MDQCQTGGVAERHVWSRAQDPPWLSVLLKGSLIDRQLSGSWSHKCDHCSWLVQEHHPQPGVAPVSNKQQVPGDEEESVGCIEERRIESKAVGEPSMLIGSSSDL